jgi:hypothetical protein
MIVSHNISPSRQAQIILNNLRYTEPNIGQCAIREDSKNINIWLNPISGAYQINSKMTRHICPLSYHVTTIPR